MALESETFPIEKLTIEDVDRAFVNNFDLQVDAHVNITKKTQIMRYNRDADLCIPFNEGTNSNYKVPVLLATGERWKLIRDSKAIRDINGVLILPLITIRKLDIDKTSGFYGPMMELPYFTVINKINTKTGNLQNQLKARGLSNRKSNIVYDVWTVPTPDIFINAYEVTIWTNYQQHMNQILEKIWSTFDAVETLRIPLNYSKDNPNGDGRYLVAYFDNTHTNVGNSEELSDQERIFKYISNYKVPAYTISETHAKDRPRSFGSGKGLEKGDAQKTTNLSINHFTTAAEVNLKLKNLLNSLIILKT